MRGPDGAFILSYLQNQSLYEPFTSTPSGTTAFLQTALGPMGYVSFTHASAGELTQVQLPHDGALTYGYRSWTFSGNVTIRHVQDRFQRGRADPGAASL